MRRIFAGYVGASLLPGLLTLVAMPALRWVVGDRFASALWMVPILLLLIVIESLYFPSVNALYYAKRTAYIPVITSATAVTNGVANLLLVPIYGLWGAIAARALSAVLRSGLMWMAAAPSLRTSSRS
jgi:O-antigen/teichoic acid export membrane protein